MSISGSNLPLAVKDAYLELDPNQQAAFQEEFRRRRKSTGVAYLLWFFLGWHYAYLGRWGVQFLYWITLGGLGIWALVDLFRLGWVVGNRNSDISFDVMKDIRAVS